MGWSRTRYLPYLVGVSLFAAAFALYLSTLAPTLTWGFDARGVDGGELLAAARTFGVPHPPGYPTYTLLLRSFATVVPFGDFAFRGNLLSAVLASASVVTVYWTALRFCGALKPDAPRGVAVTAAALGSAAFATSPLLWSQSVMTEVYTLNALFVGVLLLLATDIALSPSATARESRTSPSRKLALFGFLLGLGLGNHLTLLAMAVALAYWMWSVVGWRRLVSPSTIGAFIAGIAVYLYLPIAASQDPPISWGKADTFGGFAWMLTARPYQEYVFGVPPGNLIGRALTWLELVFSQFNPLGLFFGLMAVRPLMSKLPRFFVPALLSIAVLSIYAATYNSVDFEVLMIPAFLLFSVWISVGLFQLLSAWTVGPASSLSGAIHARIRISVPRQVAVLGLLTFLLVPGASVFLNYDSQNLRDDRSAYNYAKTRLDAVEDGSVVLSNNERSVFSLWYVGYVEEPDRDVALVAAPLLQFDWYLRDLRELYPNRFPATDETDPERVVGRIVEHNDPDVRVFFTFTHPSLSDQFDMRPVSEGLYQALAR